MSASCSQANMKLSKRMSYLLRHGAEKAQLELRPDGYCPVSELLKRGRFSKEIGEREILAVVETDAKGRYKVLDENGVKWIRANQGHTLKGVVEREAIYAKVEKAEDYPVSLHGTSLKAWEVIKLEGLCKMGRNEIHFAKGELGTVASGIRVSCQVLIYVNLGLCLEREIPFFESENGVLLSPGVGERGIISTGFFDKVVLVKTGEELDFDRKLDAS